MNVQTTPIEGLLILEPKVFQDERGFFMETFNQDKINDFIPHKFVQDNLSCSHKNVLRGLHFQAPPFAQAKLVTVLRGSVYDVAVDLRKNSPTYGSYFGIELNAEHKKLFFIPEGFAHGFLALEQDTLFHYKCSNFYHQPSEQGLLWNDPFINIQWTVEQPIVSSKDQIYPTFNTFNSPF